MNAIAAAAKKRAEKLGIQNQEVDDSNVGKADDPGDLSHPFFGGCWKVTTKCAVPMVSAILAHMYLYGQVSSRRQAATSSPHAASGLQN